MRKFLVFAALMACSSDSSTDAPSSGSSSGTSSSGGTFSASGGVSAGPKIGDTINGRITYYDATGHGSCGYPASPEDLMVAAMNIQMWNNAAVCGMCVEIEGPKGKATVRIVDQCPDCEKGQLDLSPLAFGKVADIKLGTLKVNWTPVKCNIKTPMEYDIKQSSSQWWTAISPRKHNVPIAKMEMMKAGAYVDAPRTSYNYFIVDKGVRTESPFKIRVTSQTGQVIEDTIPSPNGPNLVKSARNFD